MEGPIAAAGEQRPDGRDAIPSSGWSQTLPFSPENLSTTREAATRERTAGDRRARRVEGHGAQRSCGGPISFASFNCSTVRSKRSGDIYTVFKPGWFINDSGGLTVASVHGSPWHYDKFVPIILVRPGIASQRVFHEIETVDVAPTLSAVLGITCPSGSVGKPLVEVLQTPP